MAIRKFHTSLLRLLRPTLCFLLAISGIFASLFHYIPFSIAAAQNEQPNHPVASPASSTTVTLFDPNQRVTDLSFPVISHPAAQEFPAIYANRVVWQDARLGPADIFMADLTTGDIVNLTHSDAWEANPDIDGDFVVWRDGYDGIGIHALKLSTGEIVRVTGGHADVNSPRVSNGYVVWAARQPDEINWRILGFDLASGQQTLISEQPDLALTINIDGNLVVWTDHHGKLFLYDRSTARTTTIDQVNNAANPDVSAADQLVVWQDGRSSDSDIYGWDLAKKRVRALVTSPKDQAMPRIANGLIAFQSQNRHASWNIHLLVLASNQVFPITGDSNRQAMAVTDGVTVVWEDGRYHQTDLFAFKWNNEIPQPIPFAIESPTALTVGAFPNGQVALRWQASPSHVDGYAIERAAGITSTAWVQLATLSASATSYSDLPPVLNESYWYRVRAFLGEDFSDYSNESFNSTFQDAPDLDEQYLMVLINEARSDPAKSGYPTYPAVPPLAPHSLLANAAHSHSQSILNSAFQFGHCDSSGRCPVERALAVGYLGNCGENLFTVNSGFREMEFANKTFLESENHRNSMLSAGYTEVGVGHTFDLAKGNPNQHGQVAELLCAREGAVIPVLPIGAVVPYSGSTIDDFTYIVNFYSGEGAAPTKAQVVIDEIPHEMQLSTGKASNGTYRLTTKLATIGAHRYYFLFEYGTNQQARWPTTGEINQPQVAAEGEAVDVIAEATSCQATIRWRSMGKATHEIDYGETTSYGKTIVVNEQSSETHSAIIDGLLPNRLYHYRIRARAENGNDVPPSPDFHFSTRRPATISISSPTQNLQQAIDRLGACDIVQVSPGTYQLAETLQVNNDVYLLGTDPNQTVLQGTSGLNVVTLHGKSVLSGFTVSGATKDVWSSGVWIADNASPTIAENVIKGNSMGIGSFCFSSACSSHARIRNNVIMQNSDAAIVDTVGGSLIINNTIVDNKDGIRVDSKIAASTVRNNVIVRNQNVGLLQANLGMQESYNNVWSNGRNYENLNAHSSDTSADPLFVNWQQQDFRLQPGSPSINAGDPQAEYFDNDQSRNDMGAFGGSTGKAQLDLTAAFSSAIAEPNGEVSGQLEIVNPAFMPKTVDVLVSMPAGATLIEGRINDSDANVVVEESRIAFRNVELFFQSPVLLTFRVKLGDVGREAQSLHFPIEAKWENYTSQSEMSLIANGAVVYLPLVVR